MSTLKELKEAKQVGTVYHFTKLSNLSSMADDELQKKNGGKGAWHLTSKNGHLSTTRNHNMSRAILPKQHDLSIDKGYGVRIALDGDKMSEHHRIRPVRGLKNDNTDIFDHRHNKSNRTSRHTGEAEEAIKTDKDEFINIRPYIKHIDFVHHESETNPHDTIDDESYERIGKVLDSHGIKHSIGRKWESRGKLNGVNESIATSDDDVFFELGEIV